MYVSHVTLLLWNIMVAVGILGSLGQELDPMLHLGHTAVHTVAGALTAIANHAHLGDSNYINLINCNILFLIFTIYLPFSEIIRGPPESPWHESWTLLLSLAQMWKLNR